MATDNEKAYLHCRINLVMELLLEIVKEMEKWEIETETDQTQGRVK
jgi:hypothetical protein